MQPRTSKDVKARILKHETDADFDIFCHKKMTPFTAQPTGHLTGGAFSD